MILSSSKPYLFLLAFFTQDLLTLVTNTFAFVRLWRLHAVDIGRHLTDLLLVDTGNGDTCLFFNSDLDAILVIG